VRSRNRLRSKSPSSILPDSIVEKASLRRTTLYACKPGGCPCHLPGEL
jgi:hypothetical protein